MEGFHEVLPQELVMFEAGWPSSASVVRIALRDSLRELRGPLSLNLLDIGVVINKPDIVKARAL